MKKKILSILLAVFFSTATVPAFVDASAGPVTETETFDADSPDQEYDFEEQIKKDGKTYKLTDVETVVVDKNYKTEEIELTHVETTDVVIKGSEHNFAASMEIDGVEYQLKEVKEISTEPYKQNVTAYTDYEYVVTLSDVPGTKTVSVTNEKTGLQESVECTIDGVAQNGTTWTDSYIDIRFKNYDSAVYSWQGMYITKDESKAPLTGYDTELLASVGLDDQTARVADTYWTSEAYTVDGIVYRDARADIQTLVPIYRAAYTGQVVTEQVTLEATYVGQGTTDTDEMIYTLESTATYEVDHTMQYIFAGIIFLILLVILILFILSKKKKSENKENEENTLIDEED